MSNRKFLNFMISVFVMASLLFGSSGAYAQGQQQPPPPDGKNPPHLKQGKIKQADRQKAADARMTSLQAAGATLATAAVTPGGTPDYFGNVPNYANSPLPYTTTVTTPTPVGNPLNDRAYATDFPVGVGQLAPVFVVLPTALPAGTLTSFQTWNQATNGASPMPSAGNVFHAYVLRPTGILNQYAVVFDSGLLTVPNPTTAGTSELDTFPVAPGVAVQAGDRIGFFGQGIPVDTGVTVNPDTLSYPATADSTLATTVAPAQGSTITLGVDPGFPILSQDRTYSFRATVDVVTTPLNGGIHKFVDSLPVLPVNNLPNRNPAASNANNLGQYIPLAVAEPWAGANGPADYYVIALVQYTEKLHTDLPPTVLRGYVQLETANVQGKHVPLVYPDNTPILINGVQALAVDNPHYLGPIIVANKGTPVRVKFYNLLPKTANGGDLFIPTDTTVMGAGDGPNCSGGVCEYYTQNRATLHLHGGVTPWISDGTQHQWITPTGETTSYPQGVSVKEVPDMPGCGTATDGCQTFYYTNDQSARLMFYHDHAYGITRLNVYAGEAAGYLLRDSTEAGIESPTGPLPSLTDNIPLVIQDKTFVPDNTRPFTNKMGTFNSQLEAQDPTWDTTKYGGPGQLWFPHVYMPNQNPWDTTGANPMGRWDYGPWFWPPFTGITNGPVPNPLYDPNCTLAYCEPPYIPGTPNPSIAPEAFMDTPLVNGTAYPYLEVDPKAYRFRILNAANDRFWNLSLFVADPTVTTSDGRNNTEVKMVPFNSTYNATCPGGCFPNWWYTSGNPFSLDDRVGGVPDPATRGPAMIQIGNEAGFLPTPTVINNQPVNYNYNRRDIVVLNVQEKALFLGPAERADVIIDFSNFAGKTLILYSDSPAPVPASDPRNDYFTGDPDYTDTGGAPTTLPGYGPNTRTIMQIRVTGSGGTAPVDDVNTALLTALENAFKAAGLGGSNAYAGSQDKPLVPQVEYGTAFNAAYPANNFVRIQDNKMSFFNGPLSGIQVTNGGNYSVAPSVSIAPPDCSPLGTATCAQATVTASLVGAPVTGFTGLVGGSKYKSTPIVTIAAPPAGGTQATAYATITKGVVTAVTLINGGSGYLTAPAVTISGGGGSGASVTAVIGTVNSGIMIVPATFFGGAGYTSAPAISFTGGTGTGAAAVAVGTTMALQPKSIIENFDPDYGRMNAMLGVEIPNTTGMNQTSIPYTDLDPATELFKALPKSASATPIGTGADGTQIWKITHNGVDTHVLHWHMFNVQVINRVGWDGAVRFPDANEIGWKESVRMNPLEDIIVALRPIKPDLPWDLPNSIRLLDVTRPAGSTMDFQNVDPSGNPAAVTNQMINYGWEYVWHCHLLGHEENIMMRPMIFGVAPNAPTIVSAVYVVVNKNKKAVDLTWTDNSLNETSWTIRRATSLSGPWTTIATVASTTGPTSGTNVTYRNNNMTTGMYYYWVSANNVVGYTQTYAPPAIGYPNMTLSAQSAASSPVTVP